ncbi:MAG TPA: acylphosphatase [Candidatus Latescibacteria bacterium]|mgnify:CR=1 FL=1|nr:acylphosphatase [Candidatus Latescibacterota bacterium]
MDLVERIHARVEGRVQGVGFRWFTADLALRLGLTGFVRNLADGAVEAVAEGPSADLERWIEQIRRGPPMSRVLSCTVNMTTEPTGEYERFDIVHHKPEYK